MFSHVILGVNDLEASRKFYDALLGTLDIKPGRATQSQGVIRCLSRSQQYSPSHGGGGRVGFFFGKI